MKITLKLLLILVIKNMIHGHMIVWENPSPIRLSLLNSKS